MNVRLSEDQKIKLSKSQDVYNIMQQILLRENKIRRNQEHFWIIGLNNSLKILFIELVCLGSDNRVHINPPEVFRLAIHKLAKCAILIHNHPSGVIDPSKEDLALTEFMIKAGKFLNINIVDHLIITENQYLSFQDAGLMKQLENSTENIEIEDELAKFRLLSNEKKIESETITSIAKKLISLDTPVSTIKEATGLSAKKINELKKDLNTF